MATPNIRPGSLAEQAINKAKETTIRPGSLAEQAIKKAQTSTNVRPGSLASQVPVSSKNTNTSDSLYNIAVQSGLKDKADSVLNQLSGEQTKQIFSGGVISDIFDGLSALQYGVTGLLKGKTFSEGVRTRQSFTDKDALGDKGIPGLIAGIALDIAVDPLTYVAPATIVKKVPLLSNALKLGKEAVFGKRITKAIQETGETFDKIIGKKEVLGKFKIPRSLSQADEINNEMLARFGNDAVEEITQIGKRTVSFLRPPDKILKKTVDVTEKITPIISKKSYEAIQGGTDLGKYLARKFQWMAGADPVFKDTWERGLKNTAIGVQNIIETGKPIANITPDLASKMLKRDATGRFIRTPLNELTKVLSPDELASATKLYAKIDDLGKQAVDLGLLDKAKYEENIGEYLKSSWKEYDEMKKGGLFGAVKTGIRGIKSRSERTAQEIAEGGLTQIDNPAYLLMKSAIDLSKDVDNAKMFKSIADNFATDIAQDGFSKIPTGIKFGKLAGKYVPDNMAEYINELVPIGEKSVLEKAGKKLIANFKFYKVIMNPGTHARNVASNMLLNWWKLGIGPWRIDRYVNAISDIKNNTSVWRRAVKQGAGLDTYAANELKALLDSPDAGTWGKTVKGWDAIKKKLGDMYQSEENIAKMVAFRNGIEKGLTDEQAWKAAESATFNYAQVTPFIRKVRESLFGFPFITFTVKSTPAVLETIYRTPRRVSAIGKIKTAIENITDTKETERERAAEPSWVKNGFYVKLPIKDKYGRSAYFDLTYILPFGDLISGNFLERGTNLETGVSESQATALMNKSPMLQFISAIAKNKDFYGNKIWKDTDSSEKQLRDLMIYATKTIAPPLVGDQLPGGYNEKGERQYKGIVSASQASEENQKRTVMQELLRNVGAKIQPLDADIQESFQEYNRKKALELLLRESGVGAEFNKFYIPKQ